MFTMPEWIGAIGDQVPQWFVTGLGFLLGAVIGSYLATILWRLPRGGNANAGRSHCDRCGRMLVWYKLIPIGGYLLTRGRCTGCGQAYSREHLWFELLCAVTGAYFFAAGSWWLSPFVWLLALLAIFDARYLRLPNMVVAVLAGVAILIPAFEPEELVTRLLGGVIGFLSFWAIARGYRLLRKRDGLGFGDVKLFGALGLWVGPWNLPALLLLACFCGFGDVAIRSLRGRNLRDIRLPLGAYLAISTICFAIFASVPH